VTQNSLLWHLIRLCLPLVERKPLRSTLNTGKGLQQTNRKRWRQPFEIRFPVTGESKLEKMEQIEFLDSSIWLSNKIRGFRRLNVEYSKRYLEHKWFDYPAGHKRLNSIFEESQLNSISSCEQPEGLYMPVSTRPTKKKTSAFSRYISNCLRNNCWKSVPLRFDLK